MVLLSDFRIGNIYVSIVCFRIIPG
jgi:hypothetical protein